MSGLMTNRAEPGSTSAPANRFWFAGATRAKSARVASVVLGLGLSAGLLVVPATGAQASTGAPVPAAPLVSAAEEAAQDGPSGVPQDPVLDSPESTSGKQTPAPEAKPTKPSELGEPTKPGKPTKPSKPSKSSDEATVGTAEKINPDIAVPQPVVDLPSAVDPLASYQGQGICSPPAQPGTAKFADLIRQTYPELAGSIWIPRDCEVGGRSEHKEGRALDWMINIRDREQRQTASAFLDWLLATDDQGNEYAMARRLGVMYIGWGDRIWESYRQAWSELKGCFSTPESGYDTYCHRDHIHISLSWDGAAGQTSFWGGSPTPAPACSSWTTASSTALPVGNGLDFVPTKPRRVLDTRSGAGLPGGTSCRLSQSSGGGAGAPVAINVASLPQSPGDSVRAVVVRTTTRGSNSPADLAARTNAASPINMVSVNSPTHTTTIVPVGSDGTIAFTTTSGATHLSVDVLGYLVKPAGVGETGGRLTETSTTPLYSTAATNEPLQPGEKRVVTLAQPVGVNGVSVGGLAAVTLSNGERSGRLIIRGTGEKRTSATPVISYRRNDVVTQTTLVSLDDQRQFTVINKSNGAVDLSIAFQADAQRDNASGQLLIPVAPTEVTGNVTSLRRALRSAQGASAVILQVDATTTGKAADVTFWSRSLGTTPSLQVGRKSSLSALIVVPLNANGQIRRTLAGGDVEVTARIVAQLR